MVMKPITADNLLHDARGVVPGDVGLVLKEDGSFRVFHAADPSLAEVSINDDKREQVRQLLCLTVALQVPEVMMMLDDMLNNPAVVDQDSIIDYGKRQ